MYKLTLLLFAFFSLVFPTLAVPIPAPNEIDGRSQHNTTKSDAAGTGTSFTGRVRAFHSQPSHDPDLSARREPFTMLASVLAVILILMINLSSLFLRPFTARVVTMDPIVARCDNSLGRNMTHIDALLQQVKISFGQKSVQATVVDKCPSCGDQGIGACQNIGLWGSIHPLDFLVRHVPCCVQKSCCPYGGCDSGHLEFPLEVVVGSFFTLVGRCGTRCVVPHTHKRSR